MASRDPCWPNGNRTGQWRYIMTDSTGIGIHPGQDTSLSEEQNNQIYLCPNIMYVLLPECLTLHHSCCDMWLKYATVLTLK